MNEHEYADADSEYTNPHESTMAGLFGLPGNVDDKKVSEWFPWFDKRLAFSNLDYSDLASINNQLIMFHYSKCMNGKTREELTETGMAHTSFMQTRVHARMSATLGKNGFLIRRLTENRSVSSSEGDGFSGPRSLKDLILGKGDRGQEPVP